MATTTYNCAVTYQFKTTPFDHQREVFNIMGTKRAYALFMEMGTGKTKVAIDDISRLYQEGKVQYVLVFAPKGAYSNWVVKEIPEHMPDEIRQMAQVVLWTGDGSLRKKNELNTLVTPGHPGLRILVMNTEALSAGDHALKWCGKLLHAGNSLLCIDESTTVKSPQARRTKRMITLSRLADWRRIMTGLPSPRSPLDLYSQFEILDPRILGFGSFWVFRARYAVMKQETFGGRVVNVVVGFKNVNELVAKLKPHYYRKTKAECLDLPPKMYETRDVELTTEQVKMYSDMGQYAQAETTTGSFTSATAVITQLLRFHQITCGFVVDENGAEVPVKSNRLEALEEVLEEVDGKVIIWCTYHYNIKEVVDFLTKKYGPQSVVHYYGNTTAAEREYAKVAIQDQKSPVQYFVSTPATGRFGNTLTTAHTVVYYSNSYDLEHREQSEDRCHRIGQRNAVTYIDLVARGTVDERIIKALRAKINLAATITGDKLREWVRL